MDPAPGQLDGPRRLLSLAGIACPDRDVRDRVLARMGGDEMRREATRANHDHGLRTWPDEITAGQRRSCGCPACCQFSPVEDRQQFPVRPSDRR